MKNKSKYTAAAAQLGPIDPGDTKESVVARMLNLLIEAKTKETALVVFPELCLTTFFPRYYITDPANLDTYYESEVPISLMSDMFELVRKEKIIISFGYAEKDNGIPFNTSVYVDSSGNMIGKYRKIHLPGHYDYEPERPFQHLEKRYFTKGNLGFPTFNTTLGRLGMCICNDRRWPETYRVLALQGCEVVTLGYNTPKHYPLAPEHDHLQEFHNHLCMQAAAYANGMWVIASAKAGLEDDCELIGGSFIISPRGEIVAEAKTTMDELVVAQVDLNECKLIRENIFNFILHRQPEEYKLLTKIKL
jgi:predicted amidohydrolase